MNGLLPSVLLLLAMLLVFAAGSRLCSPRHSRIGGIGAVLLFVFHPLLYAAPLDVSLWDCFFVMLFTSSWLALEHWSQFMRSWVLAGVYAFGLWVGSAYVLWIPVAMVPWVVLSRRPRQAIAGFFMIFLGGMFLFGLGWLASYALNPLFDRPPFTHWVRWHELRSTPIVSLPWVLLTLAALLDQARDTIQERRADAVAYMAILCSITVLFGPPALQVGVVALSCILIVRMLAKREFLLQRAVRRTAVISALMVVGVSALWPGELWVFIAMLSAAGAAQRFHRSATFTWRLALEAACVGAYLARPIGSLLVHALH